MQLKILLVSFWTVFLAELGDKTQITVFTLGAGSKSRLSVFVGASLALVLSTLLAVALADVVAQRINPRWTQGIAGALLMVMGAIYVYGALRPSACVPRTSHASRTTAIHPRCSLTTMSCGPRRLPLRASAM